MTGPREPGSGPALGTLPDLVRPGLALLSIGLNPSLRSVAAGFYFAHPRNRFWPALALAGIELDGPPGPAAQELLLARGLGFTDVVKRPSAGAADLRAGDFRNGAPALEEKIVRFGPRIAWFHGKVAYLGYLRYAQGRAPPPGGVAWGEQGCRIGASRVLVTPNPSPANARFTLAELVRLYRTVLAAAGLAEQRAGGGGAPRGSRRGGLRR